jgi:hypothetical protein
MTSQDPAQAELDKQVASLIGQIDSIESDENLETEAQVNQLLSLGQDVLRLAELTIPADRQLAKELLSRYVNSSPWLEAEARYGWDGFHREHENCSELLFNLGQNWPIDLIPDSFDSEKGDFCFCAGLSMNPNLVEKNLEKFMDSAINYGYGMDEDVVLFVALLLNPNSTHEFVLKAIEQLSGDEVDWLLGIITGNHITYGYSSEKAQELIMDAPYSVAALTAIKKYVESNADGAFNQFTDWNDLSRDSNEVLEAIDLRLASKNPRFDHFENN